jgi:hypothetical protein
MSSKAVKKVVKKSTAEEDGRRRREANLIKIRKEKREEGLQKRRNLALVLCGAGGAEGNAEADSAATTAGSDALTGTILATDTSTSAASAHGEVRVENLHEYCAGELVLCATQASTFAPPSPLPPQISTISRQRHLRAFPTRLHPLLTLILPYVPIPSSPKPIICSCLL